MVFSNTVCTFGGRYPEGANARKGMVINMMKFSVDIPVKIISGRGCIGANRRELGLGGHAAIVCGRHGAAASGALGDVTAALDALGTAYDIFDGALPNPPLSSAYDIGCRAAACHADFVIGIGGGSAMDTAKAAAAFAANSSIAQTDIFDPSALAHEPLPLVLIPTTAGTGSEANPYSVLTLPDGRHKKTYAGRGAWARVAFLDPSYTSSVGRESTISTALDAIAHAMESYLSPRSDALSRMLALYAGSAIWDVISEYPDSYTDEMRDALAYASCAAGAAISITGTGFPHPLGYSLTLLDGIPHGRACAVFHGDYIEYNQKNPDGAALIAEFAAGLGTKPRLLAEYLPALAAVDLHFTDAEIAERVDLIKGAKNYANSPYVLSDEEKLEIYHTHFGK